MTDPRDAGDDGGPPTGGATTDDDSVSDERSGDDSVSDDGLGENSATGADSASTTSGSQGRTVVAADVETPGEPRTIDPRVRYSWIVGPMIGAAIGALAAIGITYGVAYEFIPLGREAAALAAGGAVFALLASYGVFRTIYLYRSWRYVVRDDSLYLTRGVFTKVQTVVPYVRVQHIDTRRSAFERVLGLSRLVVYTAGSRGADVSIPGLEPDHAEELQSRLERLAIASEDEDAV